jgi:hypothetical protein
MALLSSDAGLGRVELDVQESSPAGKAVRDGQITPGWARKFVSALEESAVRSGFGVVGGRDLSNQLIMTQSLVHRTHQVRTSTSSALMAVRAGYWRVRTKVAAAALMRCFETM